MFVTWECGCVGIKVDDQNLVLVDCRDSSNLCFDLREDGAMGNLAAGTLDRESASDLVEEMGRELHRARLAKKLSRLLDTLERA